MSRPTTYYQIGLIKLQKDSKIVTGIGTGWQTDSSCNLSKPIKGNVLTIDKGNYYVIESVDSDTQITLHRPYSELTIDRTAYGILTNMFVDGDEEGIDIAELTNRAIKAAEAAEASEKEAEASEDIAISKAREATDRAKDSSDSAIDSLAEANRSTVEANRSKNEADRSRDEADRSHEWAEADEDVEVVPGEYSSKSWAKKSKKSADDSEASAVRSDGRATDSSNSAGEALASEGLSEEWASNPENDKVTGTQEYSAKHYSVKSSDSATLSDTRAGDAEDARDVALGAASHALHAFVDGGNWDSQSQPKPTPDYNAMYYVTVGGEDKEDTSVDWGIGDFLVWSFDTKRYSQITGDPVSGGGEPQPLEIPDDIYMQPDKALRFKKTTDKNETDPIYGVGMRKTSKDGKDIYQLVIGDWNDTEQIGFYNPHADEIYAVTEVDVDNDFEPTVYYKMLNEYNGIHKESGGTINGLAKFPVAVPQVTAAPSTTKDVTNKAYVDSRDSATLASAKKYSDDNFDKSSVVTTKADKALSDSKTYTNTQISTRTTPAVVDAKIKVHTDKKDNPHKVTAAQVSAPTLTEYNSHKNNTTVHITAGERTAWNAKETPSGAQSKATTAKSEAINDSINYDFGRLD